MSTNPFASPSEYASSMPPPPIGEDAFVKQIPFVGVFMMIEGVLELCFGGFMLVFVAILAADPSSMEEFSRGQPEGSSAPYFWFALVMGLGPFLAGVFRVVGAILVFMKRGRMFCIVANVIGFLAISGCYCIPTGCVTSIYSIIILVQTSVGIAFAKSAASVNVFKPPY